LTSCCCQTMKTLFHLGPSVRNLAYGASNVICCVLKFSFCFVFRLYNLNMSKVEAIDTTVLYKVSIRLIDDSTTLRGCNNLCVCSRFDVAPRTPSTYIVLDTLPIIGGVLGINNGALRTLSGKGCLLEPAVLDRLELRCWRENEC
jgi:hypothetical protein